MKASACGDKPMAGVLLCVSFKTKDVNKRGPPPKLKPRYSGLIAVLTLMVKKWRYSLDTQPLKGSPS